MDMKHCNGRVKPCGHLMVDGAVPFCGVFRKPIAEVNKCGPKLVKLELKKQKRDQKLKGKR